MPLRSHRLLERRPLPTPYRKRAERRYEESNLSLPRMGALRRQSPNLVRKHTDRRTKNPPITRQSETHCPLNQRLPFLLTSYESNCSTWHGIAGVAGPLAFSSPSSDALGTFGRAHRMRALRQRDLLGRRWCPVRWTERHAADLESCAARMGV